MKQKENAVIDFIKMIEKSWTYDRMTNKERETFVNELLEQDYFGRIKGSYDIRYDVCHALYSVYLAALDYNPTNWRETEAGAYARF